MVVGGKASGYNNLNNTQIVDLSKQTRSCPNLQNLPIALTGATGAIVSGHPIICGGTLDNHNNRKECYHHSKASNSWTFLNNMITLRFASASVSLNGTLFIMGGSYYRPYLTISSTEYVSPDGSASQQGPDLPTPRSHHCAVKLSSGQVMLLGGSDYVKPCEL